ncbi:MAG: hypothetical protein ACXITV_10620 [Luteibaculaceae bacterium]
MTKLSLKYLFVAFAFLCVAMIDTLAAQQDANSKLLYGRLYGADDSSFVSYAHIINVTTNKGTISNDYGNFYISVSPTDSLKFRTVSYKDVTIAVKDLPIEQRGGVVLFLEREIYQLRTVEIFPFTPAELLREALAMEPMEYKKPDKYKMDFFTDVSRAPASGGFGLAFNGAISGLYSAFSKKGRELTKYYALLERDAAMEQRNSRYNASMVYKVTGMTDEAEIAEFMQRCPMSDYFLTYALDYDIVVAIIDCYKDYQRGIR